MNTCCSGHADIAYSCDDCPVCELEIEMGLRIDELEAEVAELKKQAQVKKYEHDETDPRVA